MDTQKPKAPFEEEFGGLIHDLFRLAGVPINAVNHEKILKIMPRFTVAFGREAHKAALTLVKRLQEATKDGFEAHDNMLVDMKQGTTNIVGELSKLLINLDERLTYMETKQNELDRKIDKIGKTK